MKYTLLLFICLAALTGYSQPALIVTFRSVAPFPMGAAINPVRLADNPAYRQTVEREFSSITSENHLKMHVVHPEKDRYDWSPGDVLVDFARQTGKRMHGHALLWHEAVPKWVADFSGDSLAWEGLVRDHIQTVVRHYKGRVAAWDVVNEAFLDDGTLRPTIWSKHLGPDYVARCFQYARQADPSVKLFYNEYGQEYSAKKQTAILTMLTDFRRRGIPIDGVGLQMHTNINHPTEQIESAIRSAAETGLLVHISELDIRINPGKKADFTPTDDLWQRQKEKFMAIVRAYRTLVPKAQQHGITLWNVGDGDSWIPKFCQCSDFPLPFDMTYQKKPAYDGVLAGLRD